MKKQTFIQLYFFLQKELLFTGRTENFIKRNGIRINLRQIHDNLMGHYLVEFAHVFYDKGLIIAAVITKKYPENRTTEKCLEILTNCKVTGFVPDRLKVLPYSLTEAPITKNMKLNLKVIESDAIDFEADRPEERLTEKFIEIMTKVISTDRSKLRSKT